MIEPLKQALNRPPQSYWTASVKGEAYPQIEDDLRADAVVAGGGIVGITTAFLLKQAGLKVVLLEADRILQGTTGHTTAKVTCQHGLIYDKIQGKLGLEKAAQYYQANLSAMKWIRTTAEEREIDCDLKSQSAYVYTQTDNYIAKIQKEAEAAQEIGIPCEYVEEIPLPYPIKGVLRFMDQAQFHPLKFLSALARDIPGDGSHLFEQTRAVDIHIDGQCTVTTGNGHKVLAEHAVIATHYPFYDGHGLYFSRLYPDRSYAMGVTILDEYPGGMYITAEDPGRSLRSQPFENGMLIIAGGEHHKTGQGPDTRTHYENLAAFAQDTFGLQEIHYRWSAQDYTTPDEVPYAGPLTSKTPNLYIACGFRKWGMTNGTASAHLIADLIVKDESPYQDLYDPSRFTLAGSVKNFVVENADVAKQFVSGKLSPVPDEPDLAPMEGRVVEGEGQKLGVFKDGGGRLHWVDTTCPHMGCELAWNSAEHSWDCPCHGSRFTCEGDILEGPAQKPLRR